MHAFESKNKTKNNKKMLSTNEFLICANMNKKKQRNIFHFGWSISETEPNDYSLDWENKHEHNTKKNKQNGSQWIRDCGKVRSVILSCVQNELNSFETSLLGNDQPSKRPSKKSDRRNYGFIAYKYSTRPKRWEVLILCGFFFASFHFILSNR